MREIISRDGHDRIGIVYEDDEIKSIVFGLRLYASQVRAGNVPLENLAADKILEALENIDDMIDDFEKGSSTVFPHVGVIIGAVILPYVIRMHEGISATNYHGVCDVLEVKPIDLFTSAYVARQIVNGERTETAYVDWVQ